MLVDLMIIELLFNNQAKPGLVTADYGGSGWDDNNPSVFQMKIVRTLQGEYQITNGYGPDRAPQVMQVRVQI